MSSTRIRTGLVVVFALALAACAGPQTVKSNVTSFSQSSLLDQGPRTFKFVDAPSQADSLEHATYEHLVADQLVVLGYKQDPNGRLAVSFDYSIQSQQVQVQSGYGYPGFYDPFWGGYGGGGYYGRRGRYWGGGGYGYGGWGGYPGAWGAYPGVSYPVTVARAQLKLDIRIAATNAKAFEGTAVNNGHIDEMPVLMPYLVQAIFTDFPGLNGQTRKVSVPVQGE